MNIIKVYVQLPDGRCAYLPAASEGKVVQLDTEQEASDWANYILPERVLITEASE